MTSFEWTVALRFLREGRFQSALIIGGVAIGVAVVIFITALITGLQSNTVSRTLGNQPHIVIRPVEEIARRQLDDSAETTILARVQPRAQRLRSIDQWQAVVAQVEPLPGVVAVSPMASGPAIAVRGDASKSVVILGIEPARYGRIVSIPDKLVSGSFRVLPGEAVIGKDLAADLGVGVGDRIRVVTGIEQDSARSDSYLVQGTVDMGLRDLNRRYVYVGLRSAQAILDLTGGVSNIDVGVADVFGAERVAREIERLSGLQVESWMQTNSQLLAALRAQTITTTMIRSFVLVIVALGIASVLVVSVVQKQKEIGILRAIGASRARIKRIFLLQGAIVGVIGSIAGSALALVLLSTFSRTVRNADGTPLFPLAVSWEIFAVAAGVATLCGVLAAFAPARRAARLDPAAAIRG
jgi:lipoprotein-releasing system permease protein